MNDKTFQLATFGGGCFWVAATSEANCFALRGLRRASDALSVVEVPRSPGVKKNI